jgi:photosystem II stability/assembly factor-like uncharacterized protein
MDLGFAYTDLVERLQRRTSMHALSYLRLMAVPTLICCCLAANTTLARGTHIDARTAGYNVYLIGGTNDGSIVRTRAPSQWRIRLGPSSGDIVSLAASPGCCTVYAASSDGSVWRSDDGGASWNGTYDLTSGTRVNALAIDPSSPSTAYAATDNGLYQTTDSGVTWQSLGTGLPSTALLSVAVDAQDPATIWAGAQDAGLYRSTDGGNTWSAMNNGDLSAPESVMAIAIDPADSTVVYVGTDQGLYQSNVDSDGTIGWIALSNGLPSGTAVHAVTVSPPQPDRVYVGTDGGVYVSADGGSSWTQSTDLNDTSIHAIATDPNNPAIAYAATDQGVARTNNGGAGWNDVSGDDLPSDTQVLALAITLARKTPADPVGPGCSGGHYFPHSHHNMCGAFWAFYKQYSGSLACDRSIIFGCPRTEAFVENGFQLQYTDRLLLQLVGGHVQTYPLGSQLSTGRTEPAFTSQSACPMGATLINEHCLSGRFRTFWSSHKAVLGNPISEELTESNIDNTGRSYTVQWFSKARVEYHPELSGTPYVMEVGLLGVKALIQRGWLP